MKAFLKFIFPVGLVVAFSVSAFANSDVAAPLDNEPQLTQEQEAVPEDNSVAFKLENHYIRREGSISDINLQNKRILVTDAEEGEIYFNISTEALIFSLNSMEKISLESLRPGQTVSVFYNVMTPQALSLPPQISPEVVVVHDNELVNFATVDYFNEDLISSDGTLKLNLAEQMIIVDADNNPVKFDEARGRNLLVFYNISTRSIPAQAPPLKVVILDSPVLGSETEAETEVPPQLVPTDPNTVLLPQPEQSGAEQSSVDVESLISDLGEDAVIQRGSGRYFALHKVAQALDYNLMWDADTSTVSVAKIGEPTLFRFSLDNDFYEHGGLNVGFVNPPFISNSRTFIDEYFLTAIIEAR